jgi:hypothetical protein
MRGLWPSLQDPKASCLPNDGKHWFVSFGVDPLKRGVTTMNHGQFDRAHQLEPPTPAFSGLRYAVF